MQQTMDMSHHIDIVGIEVFGKRETGAWIDRNVLQAFALELSSWKT